MLMFLAMTFQISEVVDDGTKVDRNTDDVHLDFARDTTMYLPYHGPRLTDGDVFHPLKDFDACEAVVRFSDVNLHDDYLTIEADATYDSVDKATFLSWYRELRASGWQFLDEMLESHVTPIRAG